MSDTEANYSRAARRMLDAVPRLLQAISAYINDHLGESFPESQLSKEVAAYADPEAIRTAFSQGGLLCEVAGDHLFAFTRAMAEPVTAFAPWALVRAALESGAHSAWLLDPSIDAQERAKRSFATRFDDLSQQIKLVNLIAPNSPALSQLSNRIAEAGNQADRLGMPEIRGKNGKRTGLGKAMPNATEMIAEVFGTEEPYRLLSGVAHGHSWAIMWFGYRPPEEDDGTSEYVRTRKYVLPQGIMYLSKWAAHAFSRPIWNRARLCGWDVVRLRTILESSYSELGLVESERFWRGVTSP